MPLGYPFLAIIFFYYPIHISRQLDHFEMSKVAIGCLTHFSHDINQHWIISLDRATIPVLIIDHDVLTQAQGGGTILSITKGVSSSCAF
jgi:hypothetical protein